MEWMKARSTKAGVAAALLAALWAAGAAAPPRERADRAGSTSKRSWRPRKITPPTPAEIARNRARAMAWYEKARKDVTAALHLVETKNFLIFSAWPRGSDRRVGEVCEKMHAHLRKQFLLPADQAIWAGKLPIYIFEKAEHFRKFSADVDGRKLDAAGGYLARRSDGFCHMVLNRVHSRMHFYGLLVHEAAHAFLARYETNAPIADWVNEGLAETMAAQLVPGCRAAKRYVDATAEAARTGADVSGVFEKVALEDFDYGIAQSLVRFLLARDRKSFVKFIKLMKVGMDDEDALRHAYGLSRRQLLEQWRKASRKALRRTRRSRSR